MNSNDENDRIIDEVLNRFDFVRIYNVMHFLDWKYHINGEHINPSINQIIDKARKMLKHVFLKDEDNWAMSGGFLARKEEGYLFLDFSIEDSEYNFGFPIDKE